MSTKALGTFRFAALWFAASISLAEISSGALLAEAGFSGGFWQALLGHLAGALVFFLAGWISWKKQKPAIAAVEDSFGRPGTLVFGLVNGLQLLGWTAVMIIVGARSLDHLVYSFIGVSHEFLWRLVLGGLIVLWTILGPKKISGLNTFAAIALAFLCLLLFLKLFSGPLPKTESPPQTSTGFGSGFELAFLMPLSWLPVIGDYVQEIRKGKKAILAASLAYSLGSLAMYVLGLAAVLFFKTDDPVQLLSGLWTFPALAIVLLSTLTTAFLDSYSAGISLNTALPVIKQKPAVYGCALGGLVLALCVPYEYYENFLLLLGTVFAPLYGVLFSDFFLFQLPFFAKHERSLARKIAAFLAWLIGLILYQIFISEPSLLGLSLPLMLVSAGIYSILNLGAALWITSKK